MNSLLKKSVCIKKNLGIDPRDSRSRAKSICIGVCECECECECYGWAHSTANTRCNRRANSNKVQVSLSYINDNKMPENVLSKSFKETMPIAMCAVNQEQQNFQLLFEWEHRSKQQPQHCRYLKHQLQKSFWLSISKLKWTTTIFNTCCTYHSLVTHRSIIFRNNYCNDYPKRPGC